ncbi:RNA methyltransferase [Telmatospirillum sp. J64-1]|uniref:RNA methyltransferase n=1 Tax=Telmatospirillum sp. J64-1 TaxID=2502183 RepID=UPI00115EE0D5|nr:RNA methyltransferase [Telmatospirillum sp. J64-1]
MAGTDSSKQPAPSVLNGEGPSIILVHPQLSENIGTAARAMLNCGLTDMRLVAPRENWLSEKAQAASSGAVSVLEGAKVYNTTEEAIADLNYVYATTGRNRFMTKPVVTPRLAATEIHAKAAQGLKCGVLFGRERNGLENDDLALADAMLTVPLNPAYCSLNLAQAVLVIGYEWYQAGDETPPQQMSLGHTGPATKEELLGFFNHLERELDECGFFRNEEKRPSMVRNIRNMFQRAGLTTQEVRTLHGVVTELVTLRDEHGRRVGIPARRGKTEREEE